MQVELAVWISPDASRCSAKSRSSSCVSDGCFCASLCSGPGCQAFGASQCDTPSASSSTTQGYPLRTRTQTRTQTQTHGERQELLRHHFFSNPSDWWDNRADRKSPRRRPDFRYKTSREPVWLQNDHKPAWMDSQLANWDLRLARGTTGGGEDEESGKRARDMHSPPDRWDGGADESVLLHTLSRLCEEAKLSEAVEVLQVLVQREYPISRTLFYRLLKRCVARKDLACGRRVHFLAVTKGLGSSAYLANHIIGMYASHGKLEDAVQAFRKVAAPDAYMWSSIISAHARHGQPTQAINLYREMRESDVEPDNHIFVAALKACASAEDLVSGKEVHADIRASAVKADMFLGNSLVNMYAKCGSLDEARKVFDSLPRRDVVTWNAMIAGYSQQGLGQEALRLYASMQLEGITPADRVTFVCLLQACACVGAVQQGKQVHSQIRARGLEGDVFIGSSLVDMYSKCGLLDDARTVFDSLPRRDVVTWTAMIAGYSQQGVGREALALYASMQSEGMTPANRVTFVCLLQACASCGALQQGKQLHSQIRQQGLEADTVIGNSLVNMYARCGSLKDARELFDSSATTRDVVTWNALLNGYAEHGDGHMAIQCFEEMLQQRVRPVDTTFLCLLVACSQAGLVQEGRHYFRMMCDDHGIVPTDHHYSCMVDLLGRSGQLDDAENMLRATSFLNEVVGWTALLSACKSHGDVERGQRCFDRLVKLAPQDSSSYVLLGNLYASAGRWDDVDRIERLRRSAGAVKKAAKACIEVGNEVHEFSVGEERSDIAWSVRSMNTRLKEEGGHVPQTHLVLKALSEQGKEDALCGHAEKLALAYGILNTPDGTALLVTKNLRMCDDCHSSTKIMSRLEKREIIVRDAHRVHLFVNGSCSCCDRH